MVAVVAHERGHIERGGEPHHAVLEQVLEALVGVLRRPEAGKLAHGPEAATVHRRLRTAGEWIDARKPDVATEILLATARRIEEVRDGYPRVRLEALRPAR